MGSLCSKGSQTTTSAMIETEKEVNIISYKSTADKIYELQEGKYNLFRKINYIDFLYSLVNFSSDNATLEDKYDKANINYSMEEPFFCEPFTNDIFQSFLENKILKHKAVYDEASNNETMTSIFKECFLGANTGLGLKLAQDAQTKGDESADKNNMVKKGDCIGYGILYCPGPNYIKIKSIFNIFQVNGTIKKSDKFSRFLLSLFLIASYGMVNARNKLNKYEEIGSLSKEQFKDLIDTSELKDSQNLLDVTIKLIFGEDTSQELNYSQFKAKFENTNKETSLAFLLSASGVRYMHTVHNV